MRETDGREKRADEVDRVRIYKSRLEGIRKRTPLYLTIGTAIGTLVGGYVGYHFFENVDAALIGIGLGLRGGFIATLEEIKDQENNLKDYYGPFSQTN